MKKFNSRFLLICSIALSMASAAVLGDWDQGDGHKMHYPQLPKQGGFDVAFNQGRLADDWECSETGPVTDIHFWVSWYRDDLLPIDGFSVRIWSDNPMGINGWSEPNELLWERDFYAGDWQQINIVDIDPPFDQNEGEIYWLEIDMWGTRPSCGWKESGAQHFRDDAVFWDSPYWIELRDPETGESMDLAFVITSEVELDFGDAPDPNYPTLLANDGARHIIGGPYFCDVAGADAPDPETDGQPDGSATGDDGDGNDDEDGVYVPGTFRQLQPKDISVRVCGGGGVVQIWIDFNGDEDWDDAGEQVHNAWLNDGQDLIPVTAPAGSFTGWAVARCRISSQGGLLPTGRAGDGEVEDHRLQIVAYDHGDAPDPNYPTLWANNGAKHEIVSGAPWLGPADDGPDADADGQPHPAALGDDGDIQGDDEDGVTIPPLTIEVATDIDVEVSGGGGWVYGWIDFNADGDWDDPCELVVSQNLPDGVNPISVTAPAGSATGITFARFRIVSGVYPTPAPTGQWDDGEVEDHQVEILPPEPDPGNDCTDPVLVTLSLAALPYTDTNTTCGRGDDYNDTCLAEYDDGEDIIYEVSVTEAMDVNVTLDPCGTPYTGIAIDDTCPPGSSCMRHSINNEAVPHGFCLHLEPGTYYIMVDKFSWPTCIPEFTLTIDQGGPEPANNDCDNAQAVGDVVDLPFDTTCATTDGDGKCLIGANIWYCYRATCTGDVTVSLCGSSYDTMLAVYNGCSCHPTGAMIGCNDDFDCPDGNNLQSQLTFAAFAGQDYLIEVGGYHADGGQGLLNIRCDEEPEVKWLQRPDLTSNGMDIRINDDGGGGHRVADDFECNEPGLLTHVRLWYSWKDDETDPIYGFTLTIRDDIPSGTQNPYDGNTYDYSMPGRVLWSRKFSGGNFTFEPLEFKISHYADLFPDYEWFWDPFWARDPCENGDQNVWQVDIEIDPRVAFRQRGTQENPVIYWLEVNATTHVSSNNLLGWKTSKDHWNDDAVWWDWRIYPVPRVYRELRYPPGHPNEPNSMDMAFMISTTAEANEPNGPIKWLQRPDETPNGMDIRCDYKGSWRDDIIGGIETFHFSIHEDLAIYDPRNPYSYSIPGEALWSRDFFPGEFDETLYLDLDPNYEHWFDPYTTDPCSDPCGDQQIWKYDFYIDEDEAFTQEGDPCEPKIYWLGVYVELDQSIPEAEFGWKTSIDHWNDNAVHWDADWWDWAMLWYPDLHPLHGSQVDMAFSITQPGEAEDLDFGDAPDPCYPTLLANDGARHIIGGPYFCDPAGGDAPDPEPDGQPDPWATGDDFDAEGDDEDGVNFPLLVPGQPDMVFLDVCGGGGIVELWIDYNGDGDWDEPDEFEFSGYMGDGPNTILVNPPASSVPGPTFARCRISTAGVGVPTGQADDGEVEDHMVEIEPEEAVCWDNITQCAGQSFGDSTCDGFINLGDLFALKMYFGTAAPWTPPECCSDYNHDNRVNLGDLFILKMWFGTGPYAPATGNQNCP
ncbi:MAG: DUF7901 domain-containing protein [Planctomycetota bacterium]